LNVSFFTNGINTPSSRFRIYQFLDKVQDEFNYNIYPLATEKGTEKNYFSKGNRLFHRVINLASAIIRGDRILIQKMLIFRNNINLEKLVFSSAKNGVIVDFDDSIFIQHPKFSYSIANADLVIVGNSFLADWATNFTNNVKIIPTCIDTSRFTFNKFKSFQKEIVIGWTGTKGNLYYIEEIANVLTLLKKKYRFKFTIISDSDKVPTFLNELSPIMLYWDKEKEVEQLKLLDIGIMPLPDNQWTRGKCGFKLLQYMATGTLAIGSAVGVNKEIIVNGKNGLLCSSKEDWYAKIEWALKNYGSSDFIEILSNARKTIVNKYSIECNLNHFIKAITKLI